MSVNNLDLKLFELRKAFLPSPESVLPEEKKMLAGVIVGGRHPSRWNQPADGVDFFDLKGTLEVLTEAFGLNGFDLSPSSKISYLHPGCSGDILNNTTKIGYMGKLHPSVQEAFDIEEENVFLFELEFSWLVSEMDKEKNYKPFYRNPSVQRDIALVLD